MEMELMRDGDNGYVGIGEGGCLESSEMENRSWRDFC